MGYFIGAGILAILGVVFWVLKNKRASKSAMLDMMDTSSIKDINENYSSITGSMGKGSFTHMVEVKGKAHSETPLTGQFSEKEVVYFSAKIEHEYEKLEYKKDSEGNQKKEWIKHVDVVSENEQWATGFGVKDETGFIGINPKKSKMDTEELYSTFEKGDPNAKSGGLNVKLGKLSIGLGSKSMNNGIKTTGYRYEEIGILLNKSLYVVGDANDRDGELVISKPKDRKNPFILSSKTKEEYLGSLGSAVKGFTIGAYASWGVTVVLIVLGIMGLMK